MHVHDSSLKCAQKFALQNAHETGEHDQIHFRFLQLFTNSCSASSSSFVRNFPGQNKLRRKFSVRARGTKFRVLDIAQNNLRFPPEFFPTQRSRQSRQSSSLCRNKNAESKFIAHGV